MKRFGCLFALLALLSFPVGCSKPAATAPAETEPDVKAESHEGHDHEDGDHDHKDGEHQVKPAATQDGPAIPSNDLPTETKRSSLEE